MTTTKPDSAGQGISRRLALGTAGAGAMTLLLSGCGGKDRLPSGVTSADADAVVTGKWLSFPTQDTAHAMELPGVRYTVTETGTTATLAASTAEDLGLPAPEDPEALEVRAARGEVFLVATVTAQHPSVMPEDVLKDAAYTERVLIDGAEVAGPTMNLRPAGDGGTAKVTITASVPEGVGADHAVYEVSSGDRVQRLSLVDGTRLSSDLEFLYGPEVTVAAAANWWQHTVDGDTSGGPTLAGFLLGGHTLPVLPEGTWPAEGHVLAGLVVTPLAPPGGITETSTIELILSDGSTAATQRNQATAFTYDREESDLAWFEVPHDVETATARVSLAVTAEDGGGTTEVATEEVTVTFSRGEG